MASESAREAADAVVLLLMAPHTAAIVAFLVLVAAVLIRSVRQKRWDPDLAGWVNLLLGAALLPSGLGLVFVGLGAKMPAIIESLPLYLLVAGVATLYAGAASLRQAFASLPAQPPTSTGGTISKGNDDAQLEGAKEHS